MSRNLISKYTSSGHGLNHGHVRAQLLEDVQEESKKYGAMQGVLVPRPPATVGPQEPARVFIRCVFGVHWLSKSRFEGVLGPPPHPPPAAPSV